MASPALVVQGASLGACSLFLASSPDLSHVQNLLQAPSLASLGPRLYLWLGGQFFEVGVL